MSNNLSDPPDRYAIVRWMAADVRSLTKDKNGQARWTEKQARVWLENNESHIKAELTRAGWDVIRDLMPARPNGKNYKE